MSYKPFSLLFFTFFLISDPDPFEKFNRLVFEFNNYFDHSVTRPLAKTYLNLPEKVRKSLNNFFSNLSLPAQTLAYILAGNGEKALESAGAFLLNTSIGLGGFLDPSSELNLKPENFDFDLALKCWGIDTGPYLVLPFWGPSSVRSVIPSALSNLLSPDYFFMNAPYLGLKIVERRASIDSLIDQAERISFDTYTFFKNFYLSKRSISFTQDDTD